MMYNRRQAIYGYEVPLFKIWIVILTFSRRRLSKGSSSSRWSRFGPENVTDLVTNGAPIAGNVLTPLVLSVCPYLGALTVRLSDGAVVGALVVARRCPPLVPTLGADTGPCPEPLVETLTDTAESMSRAALFTGGRDISPTELVREPTPLALRESSCSLYFSNVSSYIVHVLFSSRDQGRSCTEM